MFTSFSPYCRIRLRGVASVESSKRAPSRHTLSSLLSPFCRRAPVSIVFCERISASVWRARHGDVVEAPCNVGIFIVAASVPVPVEDDHVVELEPLGAVRGREQEPPLRTSQISTPLV